MMRGAGGADGPFGDNEIAVLEGERLGADEAGIAWDRDEHDDQNERGGARPQHGDDGQGKEDHGERAHGVKEQDQNAIEPAGAEARDEAEEKAEESGQSGGGKGNGKGGARAIDDARKGIAAEVVGSQPMGQVGALEFTHDADFQGIIGRDEGRQDGHQKKYDNQRKAEKPHGIAGQRPDAAHEACGAFSP